MELKYFYKQDNNGNFLIGSGFVIPDGFTEYDKNNPPVDLQEWFKQKEIENKWNEIRAKRDYLLKETDIYMLIDKFETLTVEQQTELKQYRQALRDIPQNFTDPDNVIFPTKPSWL